MVRNAGLCNTDNATLAIVIGAFILMLVIVLPRIIPGGRFGVSCSDLASPIPGGINQSILARTRSLDTLGLELNLPQNPITQGGPLTIQMTFINHGVGTITLFFKNDELFLGDDGADGLSFSLRSETGIDYSESSARFPRPHTRPQFTNDTLHLLLPKQRCTQTVTFDAARLAEVASSVGRLGPGDYFITAIYRNRSAGQVPAPGPGTPQPIFPDQGVYVTTQDVRSNQASLRIR